MSVFVHDEHIYEIKVDSLSWQTMADPLTVVPPPRKLICPAVGYICPAETQKLAENEKTSVTTAAGVKTGSSGEVLR